MGVSQRSQCSVALASLEKSRWACCRIFKDTEMQYVTPGRRAVEAIAQAVCSLRATTPVAES